MLRRKKEKEEPEAIPFRAVTTDKDAGRRWISKSFGTIFAQGHGEADALKKLEAKAEEIGANTVVALRFALDRGDTVAYGTALVYDEHIV